MEWIGMEWDRLLLFLIPALRSVDLVVIKGIITLTLPMMWTKPNHNNAWKYH